MSSAADLGQLDPNISIILVVFLQQNLDKLPLLSPTVNSACFNSSPESATSIGLSSYSKSKLNEQ